MFDISPMLSQSFSTFATAKNASPEERKKMAEGQKKLMADLSLKINLLEAQKRKVESDPGKYYGENPWGELKRLKKEYEDAKERYEYWS